MNPVGQSAEPGAPGLSPTVMERLRGEYGAEAVELQCQALRRHGAVVDDPALWLGAALEGQFKFMPIEAVTACPCGSTASVLLSRFVFWNLLGLRQCSACGLLFVSPRLTAQAMTQHFEEHYHDPAHPEHWGQRRLPIFRDVLRILRQLEVRRVFDVGAAYGHFLHFLDLHGLMAEGCDVAGATVQWGRDHLGVRILHGNLGNLGLDPGAYDAVVSLDTLYYVTDPLDELERMRHLVRPGGHVVLRLRNGLWTLRKARREGAKPIGRAVLPSEHLWAWTPATLGVLLPKVGLELRWVEPAAYSATMGAAFWAMLVGLNRSLLQLGVPILTQSFTAIARRNA